MKRSELEVGAVLMHHTSHDWERCPGTASTVTVLAVEPHAVVTGYRGMRGDSEPKAVEKGPGVLVERYGERKVVQLRHLRGPWQACRDEQDRRTKSGRDNTERIMRQRSLTANTARMAVHPEPARPAGEQ